MSDSEDDWEDPGTATFRKITQHAQRLNFGNTEAVRSFVAEIEGITKEKSDSGETILHYLAARPMSEGSAQHKFLQLLLQNCDGSSLLIGGKDKDTPIHVALHRMPYRKSNPVFVETLLELANSEALQKALETANPGYRNTCLHHAIQYEFRSIMKLISKCPRELFSKPNANGDTPLHLAMVLAVKENLKQQKSGSQLGSLRKDESSGKWKNESEDAHPRVETPKVNGTETPRQKGDLATKNIALARVNATLSNSAKNMLPSGREPLNATFPNMPNPTPSRMGPVNSFYLPEVVKSLLSDQLIARNTLVHRNKSNQPVDETVARSPYQYRIDQVYQNQSKHLRHVVQQHGHLP